MPAVEGRLDALELVELVGHERDRHLVVLAEIAQVGGCDDAALVRADALRFEGGQALSRELVDDADAQLSHDRAAAAQLGLEIHLPPHQPRSTLPLAACLWAGEQGRLRDFKHALYEAFFCEGEDIATDREIARAAEQAGLDPDGAVEATYSPERFERIRQIREEAAANGIRGVPSLLTGGGESHWGMGGLARLLAGEVLVPRAV